MGHRPRLPGALLLVGLLVGAAGCRQGPLVADSGPDQLEVGFGAPVTLTARTSGVPEGAQFRWEQVAGPDVSARMKGADTPRLTFITLPLDQLAAPDVRPHVVALSPHTAGEYRFLLSVSYRGRVARDEVLVTSTARHSGVSGIPIGLATWIAGPAGPASGLAGPARTPAEYATRPTGPATRPAGPASKPASPASGLAGPATRPAGSASGLAGPASRPAAPVSRAAAPASTAAGPDGKAYGWRFVKRPEGSKSRLEPANERYTRLIPDLVGQYIVEETISRIQFNLYAGRWADVPKDCGRSACHPVEARDYKKTKHASVMHRGRAGTLRGRGLYRPACLRCHATGYNERVDNGGFDDVARKVGWSLPAKPERKPSLLPNPLRNMANVTCLSCHGPGKLNYSSLALGRSVAWGIGQCARCHDAPPDYNLVAEWRRSPMNVRVDQGPGPATTKGCATCHSALGFIASVRGKGPAAPGLLRAEPVTCPACHDPHAAPHAGQLRLEREELCLRCHQLTPGDQLVPTALAAGDRRGAGASAAGAGGGAGASVAGKAFAAPHSPQGQVIAGRGGLPLAGRSGTAGGRSLAGSSTPTGELPPPGGPHVDVPGGCVRCHMARDPTVTGPLTVGGHTFRARHGAAENVIACGGHCHQGRQRFDLRAGTDADGDGVVETHRQEIDGLLAALAGELAEALQRRGVTGCRGPAAGVASGGMAAPGKMILTDAKGLDLGDCNGDGRITGDEQPHLLPAALADLHPYAYNLLLIRRDGSHGLHNYPYAAALLQQTLSALKGEPANAR